VNCPWHVEMFYISTADHYATTITDVSKQLVRMVKHSLHIQPCPKVMNVINIVISLIKRTVYLLYWFLSKKGRSTMTITSLRRGIMFI